jgi:hypothetical protein
MVHHSSVYHSTPDAVGGVVDSSHQSLVLQLMVVCPEDVCKVIDFSSAIGIYPKLFCNW